jgi:hypothetical protein
MSCRPGPEPEEKSASMSLHGLSFEVIQDRNLVG